MKLLKVRLFSCVVGAVLLALLLAPAVAQAQAAPWTVVASPNSGGSNFLFGVASVSATDVWTVGESGAGFPALTLTLHWNGTAWSVVKSPNAGSGNNTLNGVTAVSAIDVWAVGDFQAASGRQTLTEHWNGHKWRVIKSPNPGSDNILLAVVAVSTNDVWAVGQFSTASSPFVFQTLIEHWNGMSWSVVPSSGPGTQNNVLNGVTVVAPNDVWAVGDFTPASGGEQTLIEHWDGTSWSVVSSPSPGGAFNELRAVASISATDVWAVGGFANLSGGEQTLIEQWNGTSWSVVSSPGPGTQNNELAGVTVVAPTDVWVVGEFTPTGGAQQTLIEQWNGTNWNVVSSPSPSSSFNFLDAATADKSSGQAWAVGYFENASSTFQTLTEFNP